MIKYLLARQLDKEEVILGESVDWARYLLNKSILAFIKYALFSPLSTHRKYASIESICVAKLVTVKKEDCGSCLQIAINEAKRNKLNGEVIKDCINNKYDRLPTPLQITAEFTRAVLDKSGEEDGMREKLIGNQGEKALVEISLAIATARFYPTVKRALGYSKECSLAGLDFEVRSPQ